MLPVAVARSLDDDVAIYVMYFRFLDDVIFSHNGPYDASCVSSESATAEATASTPTKLCSAIKTSKTRLSNGAKCTSYNCFVAIVLIAATLGTSNVDVTTFTR